MRSLFLLWISVFSVAAQTFERELELAVALERDGQLEKSLTIYQKLYRLDSAHVQVLQGLKNVYKSLGYHDARLRLIESIVARDTTQLVNRIEKVDALYRAKLERNAKAEAIRVINLSTATEQIYRLLASTMIENRQLDDVEAVYQHGRERFRNEGLFTLEMARLHTYRGDYYRATRELIRFLGGQEDVSYLESQIGQFPEGKNETEQVIRALREYLATQPNHVGLHRLLLRILIGAGQYEQALDLATILDKRLKRQGVEILLFADQARGAGEYTSAKSAYELFLRQYPNSPQAELGLAICYEFLPDTRREVDLARDSLRNERQVRDEAIRRYRELAQRYPGTEWGAEARIRCADLYLLHYFDVDAALLQYRQIVAEYPTSPLRMRAWLRIAESLIMTNDLAGAEQELTKATNQLSRKDESSDDIQFRLAEIAFYQADFAKAKDILKPFVGKKRGRVVNDALSLLLVIQENQKDKADLEAFAKAKKLAVQKRNGEALAILDAFLKSHSLAPLTDDALFLRAEILTEQKKYADAERSYEFLSSGLQSPLGDRALFRKGEVAEIQRDYRSAIRAYKDLLIRYPQSIYGTEARKRIRTLEAKIQSSS